MESGRQLIVTQAVLWQILLRFMHGSLVQNNLHLFNPITGAVDHLEAEQPK